VLTRSVREVFIMTHNMTVTVEDNLWNEMQRYPEIRWGTVMKEAARQKLKALLVLQRLAARSTFTDKEIQEISVKLGKKITGRK